MTLSATRLRMDRSKDFSTIHGERTPDDRHARVHFYQDGLPFDAQGFYLDGFLDDSSDPDGKIRALAERRLRKLEGQALPADADAEALDEELAKAGAKGGAGQGDDVNLEAWARGEAQYIFGEVRAAIKKRFGQVVKDQKGAIELLALDEKVVPEDQLALPFKQLIGVAA
jgi:hypothetical protein